MKNYFVLFIFVLLSACANHPLPVEVSFEDLEPTAIGRIFYVSGTGNDNNDGLSRAKALATLQEAADRTEPGDSVYALNGTYTNSDLNSNVLQINTSGESWAWIRYRAYPGQSPKIKVRNWSGISVNGASYILIEGFRNCLKSVFRELTSFGLTRSAWKSPF